MKHLSVCLYLVTFTFGAKLPSTFTKCDPKQHNFQQCLPKAIENAIKQLNQPIKEVNLPNMNPLKVPSLIIGAGSGPVATKQVFKNLNVTGYHQITCSKAEFDFDKKKLNLQCLIPEFRMDFDYEMSGRILVLPVVGEGPGWIILHGFNLGLSFDLEEYEKKGKKHFRVVGHRLSIIPKRIEVKLDNLFDGDKVLGDVMNKVMNDNWEVLFADVKPSYEEGFGSIYGAIFDRLLAKVPVSELFGDK